MKRMIPALTVFVGLVLQVGIVPHVAVAGIQPNILVLGAVTIGMVKGPRAGMVSGFAAGLLSDLLGTGPVGAAALVFCAAGFLAGSIKENTFADGWSVPLVVAFFTTLTAEAGYMILLAIVGEGGVTFGGVFMKAALASLYTCAVAVIAYPLVARFLRWERPMTTFRRLA
ncbi:MAG TPA: rod shape-determining protein MreD [Coriobacteriia bacterium]|nr:rod shape-determining protein MreD [Coriobacteriia bacterium]